ncbi:hypothetical protein Anamo_1837 [Acetomicrobium mobile DSM 13181]|uniref:Uncharacterized protein n=1 Tax=Acetomicrobium mobile (strain ATCC BAA-54 / DSM 13181 / JCM 12221 / NGA) TaxID=891968 RepID=I4BYR6_ACEMN|nr:hypothetical protein [Acetomicrobium mobile]AFM22423.1 hypothetical protein Anamo_1837 [Acetomicrobium mobile DSM 13181]
MKEALLTFKKAFNASKRSGCKGVGSALGNTKVDVCAWRGQTIALSNFYHEGGVKGGEFNAQGKNGRK